jgi:NADH dehydrogenase FAD-containing subunit
MSKNVVMIGAGVANVNAATKLVDNGFKGKITIIDMGKNPYERKYSEVMEGFLGAGGWSDGKLTYHTQLVVNFLNIVVKKKQWNYLTKL